jgi:hypothetical protein
MSFFKGTSTEDKRKVNFEEQKIKTADVILPKN